MRALVPRVLFVILAVAAIWLEILLWWTPPPKPTPAPKAFPPYPDGYAWNLLDELDGESVALHPFHGWGWWEIQDEIISFDDKEAIKRIEQLKIIADSNQYNDLKQQLIMSLARTNRREAIPALKELARQACRGEAIDDAKIALNVLGDPLPPRYEGKIIIEYEEPERLPKDYQKAKKLLMDFITFYDSPESWPVTSAQWEKGSWRFCGYRPPIWEGDSPSFWSFLAGKQRGDGAAGLYISVRGPLCGSGTYYLFKRVKGQWMPVFSNTRIQF
jgi:hypothetical protein